MRMAYTTQKTVAVTTTEGTVQRSGLLDPTLQVFPQRELLERETARYEPVRNVVVAPNLDDQPNPGVDIEIWSEW
jgi:hypothetical protein